MKLELKHLAPYLPYGLKMELLDFPLGKHIRTLELDCGHDFNFYLAHNKVRPILRHLSDLTKEIEHNGERLCAIDEVYNSSWMVGGYILEEDEYGWHILSKEDNSEIHIDPSKPQTWMYWVWEIMVSLHFDVFGLIDKGLAIDINTI